MVAVTKEIISLYIRQRLKIVHEATGRISLYSNVFKKYKIHNRALHTRARLLRSNGPSKRLIFHAGDERAMRTDEELRLEKIRMSKIIDKLIEPDIKRFRARGKSRDRNKEQCVRIMDIFSLINL